jgi:tryptophan-rich sensory protein
MKKYPALRLETVESSTAGGMGLLTTPTTFLTQPWHILQWLKDPETWLLNLTKLQRHTPKYYLRRRDTKFRPDPLLFPSTWPPFYILSALAMIHAIAQTLPIKTGANTRILMQDYCLAITVLDEWKRVFLLEHRITLGLVWSALTFASFFVLASSAALEAGWIAAALLLPEVFACLVSGWMNTVLYSERYVQRL